MKQILLSDHTQLGKHISDLDGVITQITTSLQH